MEYPLPDELIFCKVAKGDNCSSVCILSADSTLLGSRSEKQIVIFAVNGENRNALLYPANLVTIGENTIIYSSEKQFYMIGGDISCCGLGNYSSAKAKMDGVQYCV